MRIKRLVKIMLILLVVLGFSCMLYYFFGQAVSKQREEEKEKLEIEKAVKNGYDFEYAKKNKLNEEEVTNANLEAIENLGGDAETFDSLANYVSGLNELFKKTLYNVVFEDYIDLDKAHEAGYEITQQNLFDFAMKAWHYDGALEDITGTDMFLSSYVDISKEKYYICQVTISSQQSGYSEAVYDQEDYYYFDITIFPRVGEDGKTTYTFVPFDYTRPAPGAYLFGLSAYKK